MVGACLLAAAVPLAVKGISSYCYCARPAGVMISNRQSGDGRLSAWSDVGAIKTYCGTLGRRDFHFALELKDGTGVSTRTSAR